MAMQPVVFKVALFRGDWDQARSQYSLLWMMEALCRINQSHIRQFRGLAKQGKVPAPYPPLYRSGVHYEPEAGTEEWLDIPTCLDVPGGTFPGPWGDCIPVNELVIRKRGIGSQAVPIGMLEVGDFILGEKGWTKVLAHAITGMKPILSIAFGDARGENKWPLLCSTNHRLFLPSGQEIRAEDVTAGTRLRRQSVYFAPEDYSYDVKDDVVHGVVEAGTRLCCDITTDTGRFWLPESGAIVHNCEDLACWRVAELREDPHNPLKAKPFAKWRKKPDGAYAYHALTLLPNGKIEDPSLVLGMGNEPEFARLRMAERYKDGTMTPSIRYAKAPDVVVVDPEKKSGYGKDTERAKQATGLVDAPPAGAPITGLITGRMPAGGAPHLNQAPSRPGTPPAAVQGMLRGYSQPRRGVRYVMGSDVGGDDVAAWGFDRSEVDVEEMRELFRFQTQK